MVIFIFIEGTYLVLSWRSSYLPTYSSAPTSIPVKEKRMISKPQPISEYEYDPDAYFDQRTSRTVA